MAGVSDQPLNVDEVNSSNMNNESAEILSKFIRKTQTPFSIAIQGTWGSGKTSLMSMIKSKLPEKNIHHIDVNAWEESILKDSNAAMLSIASQIAEKIEEIEREINPLKSDKNFKSIKEKFWNLDTGLTAANVVLGVATGGRVNLSNNNELGNNKEEETIKKAIINQRRSPLKKLRGDINIYINNIKNAYKDKNFKIVIYVDDLDRIEPTEAVKLLELLKNLFDLEHCIFVLAIDFDIVKRGLSAKFQETKYTERAQRSFFHKIIQLVFFMPDGENENYIKEQLNELNKFKILIDDYDYTKKIIKLTTSANPRSIKRLINNLFLLEIMGEQNKELQAFFNEDPKAIKILFAICCIQIEYEKIYNLIKAQYDFWGWKVEDKEIRKIKDEGKDLGKFLSRNDEKEYMNEPWEIKLAIDSFNDYQPNEILKISKLLNFIKQHFNEEFLENNTLIDDAIKFTSFASDSTGKNSSEELPNKLKLRRQKYIERFLEKLEKLEPEYFYDKGKNGIKLNKDIRDTDIKKMWRTQYPLPGLFLTSKNNQKVGINIGFMNDNTMVTSIGFDGNEIKIAIDNDIENIKKLFTNEVEGGWKLLSKLDNPAYNHVKIEYKPSINQLDENKEINENLLANHVETWINIAENIVPYLKKSLELDYK